MIRAAVALFLLVATVVTPANADDLARLQSFNNAHYYRFKSETLGRSFDIFVRLPESYDASKESYPAAYLLDGGITFPLLSGYYRYLSLSGEAPDMILVGISYGADAFEDGNFRGTDFTAPSPQAEHYGGAAAFQTALETELLPYIESKFRADPHRRLIFGQSLGGQFVLFTALTKPDLFWGHIASNPALHRNLPFFLDFDFDEKDATSSKVFASSGSLDDDQFREPALEWFDHWSNEKKPWRLKTVTLPGETHFSAAPAAFRQGVAWLFAEDTAKDE
jgi:hypothetical protein